jgi:hypothetical protein
MIENKYKIGQFTEDGVIVSITDTTWYCLTANSDFISWDEKFENWRKEPIYYIYLFNPRRNMTFEEYKKYVNNDAVYLEYCIKCPFVSAWGIPEQAVNIKELDFKLEMEL